MSNNTEYSTVAHRAVELTVDESNDVRIGAIRLANELEARYWACRAFIEQYPVNDLRDTDDAHHIFAMGFALDLTTTPQVA